VCGVTEGPVAAAECCPAAVAADADDIVRCAILSQAAYLSGLEEVRAVVNGATERAGILPFDDVSPVGMSTLAGGGVESKMLLALGRSSSPPDVAAGIADPTGTKTIYVCFRGTADVGDAVADARCVPTDDGPPGLGGAVHEGFWARGRADAWLALGAPGLGALVRSGYRVVVSGHSLGGGSAVMSFVELLLAGATRGDDARAAMDQVSQVAAGERRGREVLAPSTRDEAAADALVSSGLRCVTFGCPQAMDAAAAAHVWRLLRMAAARAEAAAEAAGRSRDVIRACGALASRALLNVVRPDDVVCRSGSVVQALAAAVRRDLHGAGMEEDRGGGGGGAEGATASVGRRGAHPKDEDRSDAAEEQEEDSEEEEGKEEDGGSGGNAPPSPGAGDGAPPSEEEQMRVLLGLMRELCAELPPGLQEALEAAVSQASTLRRGSVGALVGGSLDALGSSLARKAVGGETLRVLRRLSGVVLVPAGAYALLAAGPRGPGGAGPGAASWSDVPLSDAASLVSGCPILSTCHTLVHFAALLRGGASAMEAVASEHSMDEYRDMSVEAWGEPARAAGAARRAGPAAPLRWLTGETAGPPVPAAVAPPLLVRRGVPRLLVTVRGAEPLLLARSLWASLRCPAEPEHGAATVDRDLLTPTAELSLRHGAEPPSDASSVPLRLAQAERTLRWLGPGRVALVGRRAVLWPDGADDVAAVRRRWLASASAAGDAAAAVWVEPGDDGADASSSGLSVVCEVALPMPATPSEALSGRSWRLHEVTLAGGRAAKQAGGRPAEPGTAVGDAAPAVRPPSLAVSVVPATGSPGLRPVQRRAAIAAACRAAYEDVVVGGSADGGCGGGGPDGAASLAASLPASSGSWPAALAEPWPPLLPGEGGAASLTAVEVIDRWLQRLPEDVLRTAPSDRDLGGMGSADEEALLHLDGLAALVTVGSVLRFPAPLALSPDPAMTSSRVFAAVWSVRGRLSGAGALPLPLWNRWCALALAARGPGEGASQAAAAAGVLRASVASFAGARPASCGVGLFPRGLASLPTWCDGGGRRDVARMLACGLAPCAVVGPVPRARHTAGVQGRRAASLAVSHVLVPAGLTAAAWAGASQGLGLGPWSAVLAGAAVGAALFVPASVMTASLIARLSSSPSDSASEAEGTRGVRERGGAAGEEEEGGGGLAWGWSWSGKQMLAQRARQAADVHGSWCKGSREEAVAMLVRWGASGARGGEGATPPDGGDEAVSRPGPLDAGRRLRQDDDWWSGPEDEGNLWRLGSAPWEAGAGPELGMVDDGTTLEVVRRACLDVEAGTAGTGPGGGESGDGPGAVGDGSGAAGSAGAGSAVLGPSQAARRRIGGIGPPTPADAEAGLGSDDPWPAVDRPTGAAAARPETAEGGAAASVGDAWPSPMTSSPPASRMAELCRAPEDVALVAVLRHNAEEDGGDGDDGTCLAARRLLVCPPGMAMPDGLAPRGESDVSWSGSVTLAEAATGDSGAVVRAARAVRCLGRLRRLLAEEA